MRDDFDILVEEEKDDVTVNENIQVTIEADCLHQLSVHHYWPLTVLCLRLRGDQSQLTPAPTQQQLTTDQTLTDTVHYWTISGFQAVNNILDNNQTLIFNFVINIPQDF